MDGFVVKERDEKEEVKPEEEEDEDEWSEDNKRVPRGSPTALHVLLLNGTCWELVVGVVIKWHFKCFLTVT